MKRFGMRLLLVLTGLGLIASREAAIAHPHVTVVAKAAIMLDAKGQITGIRHAWTFDEAYSAYATTGMKTGSDGKVTKQELEDLAKLNVESLSEFKYFTQLKRGKSALAFASPKEGYYLEHDGKALTLHFVLPLEKPAALATGQSLRIDDETIFVAFSLAPDDPVTFEGPAGACKIGIRRPAQSMAGSAAPISEDFFNNLKAGFSEQYASSAEITCP